jgi:predicted secreted protein
MSGVWILLGLAVLAMIVRTAVWAHDRADRSNLGFVSAGWLAEQRLSQSQDHK